MLNRPQRDEKRLRDLAVSHALRGAAAIDYVTAVGTAGIARYE